MSRCNVSAGNCFQKNEIICARAKSKQKRMTGQQTRSIEDKSYTLVELNWRQSWILNKIKELNAHFPTKSYRVFTKGCRAQQALTV